MVGGLDRYYQIARCLRDEDLRADRQFEFMQLDMEASFVGQAEVLAFITEAVGDAAEAVTGTRPTEMGRITWHEAMDRYGSDKPDTRFGMELVDLTDVFAGTEFNAFKVPCIKGIRVPGQASLGRNKLDGLTDDAKRWGAKGLVWIKATEDDLESPVAKFLSDTEKAGLRAAMGAEPGDLILIVAGEWDLACHVLGLMRLALGKPPVTEGGLTFLWVVDFPLFESVGDDGKPVPAHHAFTMPHLDDWDMLDSTGPDLLKVRSQAYDLTLNGWELGSGSVRIHRPDIQSRIFELLGIGAEEAQRKFGFLLDAFRYGAPPHAGFAFGIDRLAALLAGEENIREVTAFPKTQSGADPLTGAPSDPDPAHLQELGIRVLPPKA
jgi:aspartyl-tRNA synthetase